MPLISNEYSELNRQLHESNEGYGTIGHRWAPAIIDLCRASKSKTVLDYGCGKGTLREKLLGSGLLVREYDPAIAGKEQSPDPADIVVCTDVLEHIEPDCLDEVLDDLKRVTGKGIFLSVAVVAAEKFLADGRNAHLIIEDHKWWLPKLFERWSPVVIQFQPGEFFMVAR